MIKLFEIISQRFKNVNKRQQTVIKSNYKPWKQEGPLRGLRGSEPWTLDLWPRSYVVVDSCKDSCEHWLGLCKPTLITSFLPILDKESDTPNKSKEKIETHPGFLVISLSYHRERRCSDRLLRWKFSKEEKKRTNRPSPNYILSYSSRYFHPPFLNLF